jgi:hypothetical protein
MSTWPHWQRTTSFTGLGLWLLLGCQAPARVVQTVLDPHLPDAQTLPSSSPSETPDDSLGPDQPNTPDQPSFDTCPDDLDDRITVSSVQVSRDIRYKLLGYEGFPFDERVAFAPARDGTGYAAWTDDATGRAVITPLDDSYERAGDDIDPNGYEVGGLVAQDDGFALLTLRDDPALQGMVSAGDPNIGRAVMLVRFRNGAEVFASPLTGTRAVTQPYRPASNDSAPGYLYGRLAWNGAKYGAYFIVRQSPDASRPSMLTDKLVYLDDSGGGLRGGFSSKCTSNQGLRLWPEADVYTPVCITDSQPAPGINLVPEDRDPLLLAAEASAPGWSAGQMGSIVKLPGDNTYFVGWLSRDVVANGQSNQTARLATDIALVRLGPDLKVIGEKRWLVETPNAAETNLHFARYGQSHVLMIWDAIINVRCDRMCYGSYAGTYARVLDREGNVVKEARLSAVPNHHDDLVTLPNGDVVWAYVPDEARDYSAVPPSREDRVLAPAKRTFSVARLRYCE